MNRACRGWAFPCAISQHEKVLVGILKWLKMMLSDLQTLNPFWDINTACKRGEKDQNVSTAGKFTFMLKIYCSCLFFRLYPAAVMGEESTRSSWWLMDFHCVTVECQRGVETTDSEEPTTDIYHGVSTWHEKACNIRCPEQHKWERNPALTWICRAGAWSRPGRLLAPPSRRCRRG